MVSYRYMDMYMHDLLSGTQSESKNDVFTNYIMAPEKMNMQMHMLMGMYGITDRFTAMVMVPYLLNSMDMSMYTTGHVHGGGTPTSPIHSMNTNGLGDIKLHLLYAFFQKSSCQFLASLGTSVPTGSIQKKGSTTDAMYPNTRYPYGMQLGSGSVELLPGVNYIYQKSMLAFSTSVSGVYRANYNTVGYKLSPELNISSWIAYQWVSFISSSLRLEGNFSGPIDGADPKQHALLEPSANTISYGSNKVNAYIGCSFHLKGILSKHRLSAEYGMPLYQYVHGIQLKQKYTINASWSYRF